MSAAAGRAEGRRRWLCGLLLGGTLGTLGCYSYVPAAPDTVPAGVEVRVLLTPGAIVRLDALGARDPSAGASAELAGLLVRRSDGGLSVRVPLVAASVTSRSLGVLQEIALEPGEVVRMDRRQLDQGRTALTTATLVGTGAAVILKIVEGGAGERRLPLPGSGDDLWDPPR
jgi:hypothetical protein